MVNIICKNCGKTLSVNESQATVFCENCGEKLEITAENSNSDSMASGEAAFAVKNYTGAYNFFTAASSADRENKKALLLAGICSARISTAECLKIEDGISALTQAASYPYTGFDKHDLYHRVADEVIEFCDEFVKNHAEFEDKYIFPNALAARTHFSILYNCFCYLAALSDMLTSEVVKSDTTLEPKKKAAIKAAIGLAEKINVKITYTVGMRNVKKGYKYVEEAYNEKIDSPYITKTAEKIKLLKTAYNTIPSTLSAISDFDETIKNSENLVNDFDTKFKAYLDENEEAKKKFKGGFLGIGKKKDEVYDALPDYLKELKAKADENKAKIEALQKEKKAFIKENTLS